MRVLWDEANLPEAVRRYNAIAEAVGKALPEIKQALDGSRVTAAGVDKKTRDIITAAMNAHFPKDRWARWFLDTTFTYSVYIKADFNSHTSRESVEYAGLSLFVAFRDVDGPRTWTAANTTPPKQIPLCEVKRRLTTAQNAESMARHTRDVASFALSEAAPFVQ